MFELKQDWELEPRLRHFVLEDYTRAVPRWCPGCGDHAVLAAFLRLARDEQLVPEKTVVVSGIGCSGRFPHYVKTYGFHGLHGRPLPVACGIRSRRPDLNLFVITGDGDSCAIGTGHWIHAIRYNIKMTVLLLDNHIYSMTKMQSSPTTPEDRASNTHPRGNPLPPLIRLTVTLGVQNASFVAQTIDWNPPQLYATLRAAHHHPGLAFVRVLQRCPHYMPEMYQSLQQDSSRMLLLTHADGIQIEESAARLFKNKEEHEPSDLTAARRQAEREDVVPVGLLYHTESVKRYDLYSARGLGMSAAAKAEEVQSELNGFLI